MTDWSRWSPCSVTCGLGRKMRTRIPINKSFDVNAHHKRMTRLYNSRMRTVDDDNEGSNEEEDDYNENTLGNAHLDPHDPCKNMPTVEEVVCGHEQSPCENDVYGVPRKF